MIDAATLEKQLCTTFCSGFSVNSVPAGIAVTTAFSDKSGDKISFYLVETPDGFRIEDDGDYLSTLIGMGIPIDQGQRGVLLESILGDAGARWDRDTYEISTEIFSSHEISNKSIDFLSALIRVRDLELLSREMIRSTFREDATAALKESFSAVSSFEENSPISSKFSEFPSDLVIRPKSESSIPAAVYFVNTNDKLNEALLLQLEAQQEGEHSDFKVIALLEDANMGAISRKKFQRAQNRSLIMPIFRGDESAAMRKVGKELKLASHALN